MIFSANQKSIASLVMKFLFLPVFLLSMISLYGQLPQNFHNELVSRSIDQPTSMVFLPDKQLLITQKTGEILLCDPAGVIPVNTTSYLSITNIHTDGEHGLIDITLDPEFVKNGFLYVYYTQNYSVNKQKASINTISRFTHDFNSNKPVENSELILWENSESNVSCCHMGGSLMFGADGKLYLTTGEDFDLAQAQDLKRAGGKVIRMVVFPTTIPL